MYVWPGHRPSTRTRMLGILERAAGDAGDLSLAECALFTACEFRACVAARALCAHLRSNAVQRLRTLALVYSSIGATHFARLLDDAQVDLSCLQTSRARQVRLQMLEQHLLVSTDPVDRLLARFAEAVSPPSASHVDAVFRRRIELCVPSSLRRVSRKERECQFEMQVGKAR
jgi:hypothetical protein